MAALDLLSDSLISVQARADALSLPAVFARLAQGEDLHFDRLRPHQQAPWHAFLVQLAFHALDQAGLSEAPTDADAWRELLRALAPEPTAWHLVADALTQPAFLQAPCLAGCEAEFNKSTDSLQALDLLVTSKNHDEKAEKLGPIETEQADALVYALITLQGWAPYQGAGNFSTMRMNGGFSARTQFRLVQQRGSGAEWRRDLRALLAQKPRFIEPRELGDMGSGRALRVLWLEPWGDAALAMADVHPLALEVCRRVRVVATGPGHLSVRRAGSKSMRVDAKRFLGAVRDPWSPLILGDGEPKALTARHDTLGYKRLSGLLFDRSICQLPLLATVAPGDDTQQPANLVAQVLVGESGGSDGLLRREIPMPRSGLLLWQRGEARLGQRARLQLDAAGQAWGKALRSALLQYLDGSAEVAWKNSDFARMVEPWAGRWDAEVDRCFFEHLFAQIDANTDTASESWIRQLAGIAKPLFEAALAALPTRNGSHRVAAARAEQLLRSSWRKQFNQGLDAQADEEPSDATHA